MTSESQLYLNGMIRAGESLLSGSGSRTMMFFYSEKYFKAAEAEGITKDDLDNLQKYQNLLPDNLIGAINQANMETMPPIRKGLKFGERLKGARHEKTKQYHL